MSKNPEISDVGVVALAEGLSKATQTFLRYLDLSDVGTGDGGISGIVAVVYKGSLNQLFSINLSENNSVIDRGIIFLAQAIDAHGLPTLKVFSMMVNNLAAESISAIAGCPRPLVLRLDESKPEQGDEQ